MAALYKIELQPAAADQWVSTVLDGTPYRIRVLWNERGGYFALSIYTPEDDAILENVKMVKNYGLIQRFADTRLPSGELYFVQDNGTSERPCFDDLATTHNLYYFEQDKAEQPVPAKVVITP